MQSTLSELEFKQLLGIKTETINIDYKEKIKWVSSQKDDKDNRVEIIKDILGMANTQGGGKIIFGVRDSDYEPVGLSEEEFESFDQTKVNDLLHRYTEPKFSCQVYKHKTNINNDERLFVIIDVPEFREEIILCKNNYPPSGDDSGKILKRGYIYIRTEKGSTESISSAQEMRELLGRAIAKKGDELLNNIDRLIKGKPSKTTEDSKEKYKEEIEKANAYFLKISYKLNQYGYWELYAYPNDYNPERILERKRIKELIGKCKVYLGSWYFPHQDFSYKTFSDEANNFHSGIESYINQEDLSIEGYRAYRSGLFVWKKVFIEDMNSNKTEKSFLYLDTVILFITGFLLFFKRYYEEIAIDSSLHIEIKLNKTRDRLLVKNTIFGVLPITPPAVSGDGNINIEKDIRLIELKASYREIAEQMIMEIFELFNYEINGSVVDEMQSRYFGQAL